MIDNSTNIKLWLELYNDVNISITNSSNQYGGIYKDINNNYLGTPLQDNVYIDKCISFSLTSNTNPYILIYDDTQWCMIKGIFDINSSTSNIIGRFVLRQNKEIKYKLRANIYNGDFDGNSISISGIGSQIIYKVILNSNEITDYNLVGDVISFTNYNLFGNTLTVIYYSTYQDVGASSIVLSYSSPQIKQPLLTEILNGIDETGTITVNSSVVGGLKVVGSGTKFTKFNYNSSIKIGNETRFIDLVVSDTEMYLKKAFTYNYSGTSYKSYPYICLENTEGDMSNSISRDFINKQSRYLRNDFGKINKETKSLSFSYFINNNNSEIYTYPIWTNTLSELIPINKKFRIIITNINVNDIIYYINIKNNEGDNFSESIDKNKINFSAKYQDKITTKEDGGLKYGDGYYGLGSYGGYKVIIE